LSIDLLYIIGEWVQRRLYDEKTYQEISHADIVQKRLYNIRTDIIDRKRTERFVKNIFEKKSSIQQEYPMPERKPMPAENIIVDLSDLACGIGLIPVQLLTGYDCMIRFISIKMQLIVETPAVEKEDYDQDEDSLQYENEKNQRPNNFSHILIPDNIVEVNNNFQNHPNESQESYELRPEKTWILIQPAKKPLPGRFGVSLSWFMMEMVVWHMQKFN
jgi:hypothetical protein